MKKFSSFALSSLLVFSTFLPFSPAYAAPKKEVGPLSTGGKVLNQETSSLKKGEKPTVSTSPSKKEEPKSATTSSVTKKGDASSNVSPPQQKEEKKNPSSIGTTKKETLFPPVIPEELGPEQKVIVYFKEKVDKESLIKVQGKIKKEFKHIPAVALSVPANALKGLQHNPHILSIEMDSVLKVKGQIQDWGIPQTKAPSAWNAGWTGKGVKVAVLDTGIAPHPDLVIAGGSSLTSYTSSYTDDNGHGTHVAGIIGAQNNEIGTVGIAPDASLYAVKVLDSAGSGYLSDVVAGMEWAMSNKMDIINLSLGSPSDSYTLHQAVDKAYNQGILVVAAAGNNGTSDGSGDTVEYPARYSSVIGVAATDVYNKRGYFSATGNEVEVASPGVSITSTYLNQGYAKMNGTSMATPYVAGNLALIKQSHPTLSASELRTLLQQSALDVGTQGKDAWYGYGLIQAPIDSSTVQQPVVPASPAHVIASNITDNSITLSWDLVEGTEQYIVKRNGTTVYQGTSVSFQNTGLLANTSYTYSVAAQNQAGTSAYTTLQATTFPSALKSSVTTLTTSKSVYATGETILVKVKVSESNGIGLYGAKVSLVVTKSNKQSSIYYGTTNSQGEVWFKFATSKQSPKGKYQIKANGTMASYTGSSAYATFQLK